MSFHAAAKVYANTLANEPNEATQANLCRAVASAIYQAGYRRAVCDRDKVVIYSADSFRAVVLSYATSEEATQGAAAFNRTLASNPTIDPRGLLLIRGCMIYCLGESILFTPHND